MTNTHLHLFRQGHVRLWSSQMTWQLDSSLRRTHRPWGRCCSAASIFSLEAEKVRGSFKKTKTKKKIIYGLPPIWMVLSNTEWTRSFFSRKSLFVLFSLSHSSWDRANVVVVDNSWRVTLLIEQRYLQGWVGAIEESLFLRDDLNGKLRLVIFFIFHWKPLQSAASCITCRSVSSLVRRSEPRLTPLVKRWRQWLSRPESPGSPPTGCPSAPGKSH